MVADVFVAMVGTMGFSDSGGTLPGQRGLQASGN